MQAANSFSFERFAIPNVLSFEEVNGLVKAIVNCHSCTGEIFLQGAHVTRWQPVGKTPALFLSARSLFERGKAIRGGIPLIFPWFGQRSANSLSNRTDGPSHGFARTSEWTLIAADSVENAVELSFELSSDNVKDCYGVEGFDCLYKVRLGENLELTLTVANNSNSAIEFEEAFHTYLEVADSRQSEIVGLGGTEYIDKVDNFKRKTQSEASLVLTSATDRPYLNTCADLAISTQGGREIRIAKQGSQSTVIWNPWLELTSKMSDMSPDDWQQMVCVETANVGPNSVKLEPNQRHTMSCVISVTK